MDLTQVFHDTYTKTKSIPIKVYKCTDYNVSVDNINCITCIINLRKEFPDKKICLLNFANGTNPGGGVTDGARAQEEDICRTTNLYHSLKRIEYPIKSNEIIVSENVKLIKNALYQDIVPINIDYVLTKDATVTRGEFDEREAYQRINLILSTAYKLKIDILVLGAFGCGVFRNPPERVSCIFKELLKIYNFDKVIFAILEKGNKLNDIFKDILH